MGSLAAVALSLMLLRRFFFSRFSTDVVVQDGWSHYAQVLGWARLGAENFRYQAEAAHKLKPFVQKQASIMVFAGC